MDSRPHNTRTRPQGSPAVLGAPPIRRVRDEALTLHGARANAPQGSPAVLGAPPIRRVRDEALTLHGALANAPQ
ncbi:hypothetical protein E4U33_008171, partial [Claviceps sp. LM78 group G4]